MAPGTDAPRIAACEMRSTQYKQHWKTDLLSAPGEAPGYCCYALFCSCCSSYSLRKRAIYNDMTRYVCCAGFMPCSGKCKEQSCPECCLCMEVTCCFAQSVASTRWVIQVSAEAASRRPRPAPHRPAAAPPPRLTAPSAPPQDEMHLQNTKCDNCLIGTMIALQYISCVVSVSHSGLRRSRRRWLFDAFLPTRVRHATATLRLGPAPLSALISPSPPATAAVRGRLCAGGWPARRRADHRHDCGHRVGVRVRLHADPAQGAAGRARRQPLPGAAPQPLHGAHPPGGRAAPRRARTTSCALRCPAASAAMPRRPVRLLTLS
jgi:hypothetical protein